jgi:hypothetical protein
VIWKHAAGTDTHHEQWDSARARIYLDGGVRSYSIRIESFACIVASNRRLREMIFIVFAIIVLALFADLKPEAEK